MAQGPHQPTACFVNKVLLVHTVPFIYVLVVVASVAQ